MKKLPEFKTQDEEIKFWEKHSIADYWDELEEGKDIFKRPKLTPVTHHSGCPEKSLNEKPCSKLIRIRAS